MNSMEKMIKLKIDNKLVEVPEGSTILDAADKCGIKIPTLCYLKDINKIGACRMCLVEVKNQKNLVTACCFPASDGIEVLTNSPRVIQSRKCTLELLLSNHPFNCNSCERNQNCELQALANLYDVDVSKYEGEVTECLVDTSSPCFVRDNKRCILCKRCEAVCKKQQAVGVIGTNKRGFDAHIACIYDKPVSETTCVACGQCVINCPTGALHEKSHKKEVIEALFDNTKRTVIACAPATRVSLGEMFGMPFGTNVEKKMITAFRRMGFDDVFDIDFAADLTIMEEAEEFVSRLTKQQNLPMFTSCSPGWVNFVENCYPEFIPNLSTCKSPQGMFGSIVKTYYAKKLNMKPEDLFVVTVMPCIAKKMEKDRQPFANENIPDVDAVLTVRECGELIKQAGLNLVEMEDGEFDNPLGLSTGAGVIFGNTGGVMEAALRTLADRLENKEIKNIEYLLVRGLKGVKEATIEVAGKKVKIAVISGLANARNVLEKIKKKEAYYDFVEVMACPGGCVNGGGMPIHSSYERRTIDIIKLRAQGLYDSDIKNTYRKSHKNPYIVSLYEEFLKKPNSEVSHKILHTKYTAKDK